MEGGYILGGLGSGRWYRYGTKTTVEECRAIDVNKWAREDRRNGRPWSWQWPNDSGLISTVYVTRWNEGLWLEYHYGSNPGSRAKVGYLIGIEFTSTGFGQRPWFLCPVCSRRSGKLYLTYGCKLLICRKCAHLAYRSQNES